MFTRHAESTILEIKENHQNLFDELKAAHANEYATIATMDEQNIQRQNYMNYRRLAEKRGNILAFATRAISAHESWGPNKNGDAFERDQLVQHHKTFIMRPHIMNHQLEVDKIRGLIAHADWRPLVKTGSQTNGDFVETLIFVDRDVFPKYAKEIETGLINSFSMGVEVQEAICSHCGNVATSPKNLCPHAANLKNLVVAGRKVFEYNRGLTFIEQSAVVSPADPDSHLLYIVAQMKNTAHIDIERLKKLASVLETYSADEKVARMDEFYMIETYANRLADRIMKDLNILPRR
jgi:hypothetical protein